MHSLQDQRLILRVLYRHLWCQLLFPVPPAATPANSESIWIKQTSGHFAPSNSGLPLQCADSLPPSPALSLQVPADDPLILEGQYCLGPVPSPQVLLL